MIKTETMSGFFQRCHVPVVDWVSGVPSEASRMETSPSEISVSCLGTSSAIQRGRVGDDWLFAPKLQIHWDRKSAAGNSIPRRPGPHQEQPSQKQRL